MHKSFGGVDYDISQFIILILNSSLRKVKYLYAGF